MKKDNKKALYENIMASVAKEVKKVLNESEYSEIATSDAEEYISEIGKNIASILLNNMPAKQLDIMLSAITEGMYLDEPISPIFALNSILMPLCHRTINKEGLF